MLETIRTHRRWLLFFVLVLILPSFVFFGIQGYNQLIEGDKAVAQVAGASITQPEVDEAQRRFVEQLRRQFGESFDPKLVDTPEARAVVLERLMNEKALNAEVKRAHMSFSDAQLAEFYAATPEFLDDGKFSAEKKTQIAQAMGLTGVGLDAVVRREQMALSLRKGVLDTAIVPASVRDRLLILTEEVREVRELKFNVADFLKQAVVSDEAIEAHYKTNSKRYELPETVSAEFVVLSLDEVASQVRIDEAQLRKQHEDKYGDALKKRDEVRAKAQALLDQLRKTPDAFAELAKKNSEDPGSAAQGGLLPPFGRGEMVKPFEQAAFALRKGELASKLVESEFGFHIVKLDDVQKGEQGERRVARHILLAAPEVKRFEDVRAQMLKEVQQQQAQRQFLEAVDTFSNMVYEQSDSLAPVAEKLNLKVQQAQGLRREGPMQALPPKVIEALFADDALKAKRNTQAVEVQPGRWIAARVVGHQPSALQPLEAVRAQIQAQLQREAAQRLAQEAAEKKLEQLRQASSLTGFAPARKISRVQPEGLPPEVIKAVMAPAPTSLPTYVLAKADAGSVALYAVLGSVKPQAPDPSRIQSTARALAQQAGTADDIAYMASLQALHKAKVLKAEYRKAKAAPTDVPAH